MNWLSDIVFNAPPSSARARRTRGGATPARAPNSAPARQIRDGATSAEKEMEISSRVYRMVHDGRSREDDDYDEKTAAEARAVGDGEDEDGEGYGEDDDEEDDDEEDEEEEEEEKSSNDDIDEDDDGDEDEEELDDYASLTVSELRDMLLDRDLTSSGVKADLIERLRSHDLKNADSTEFNKSLEMSMQASKEVSDLFFLNERLHDIIQNETHKDKEVNLVRSQLKDLRDEHTSDLAELSMDASVTNIRKKSLQGLAMMRDATMQDTEALDAMEAKVSKIKKLENDAIQEIEKDKKDLEESTARGDAIGSKISKVSASTAACKTRTLKSKSEAVISEAWYSLYETALEGIDIEFSKHDEQRDQMVEKLQSIVADVTDKNDGQVSMMERHSADIIAESKQMMQEKFEARSKLLKEKYIKLRELLETQHELGDGALQKHQQYLEEHYKITNDEKCEKMEDQYAKLESEVQEFTSNERSMRTEVQELKGTIDSQSKDLKEKSATTKKQASDISSTQASIVGLRDSVYDTRLQLEEAERKEQKMATDYEILMVENSHLTEEIDKFGEIVQRAERALEAGALDESGLSSLSGAGTSSLSAIKEQKTPKSGSKRKQTPRKSSSKKQK